MKSTRRVREIMYAIIVITILPAASLFAGLGIVQLLNWVGFESVTNAKAPILGLFAVLFLYVIPRGLSYVLALRRLRRYYPVTNDIVRNHRQFYLENIQEEIEFVKKAIDYHEARELHEGYKFFKKQLATFLEIKSLLQSGYDLKREHLVYLNKTFNKRYLLRKLR